MSLMLFAGVFAGILVCLVTAEIRKCMAASILRSIGSAAIVLGLMAGTVEAADKLSTTLKVGQTPTGSDRYLYRNISGAGLIYEDSLSGSIPGMTLGLFSYASSFYITLNGAPTTPGVYTATGYYHYFAYENQCTGDPDIDDYGCANVSRRVDVTVSATITVEAATLTVSPDSLGSLAVGQAASVSLSTSGGSGQYTYAVHSGALPSGLSLSGSSITGTPSSVGPYSFSIAVSDSYGNTASKPYSGTVEPPTPSVSLTASDSSVRYGDSVTFTATLSGGDSPSGSVTFKDGATTLGTSTLSGNTASFATSDLSLGSRSITAVYSGDSSNQSATSSAISVSVGQASPSLSLSASDTTATLLQPIILTATLSGGVSPTGTVTFKDGSTTLGTATISGASATFSTSTLSIGSHAITAVYGGDISHGTATSSAVTVTIEKAGPSITLSSSSTTPTIAQSVTFTASLSGGVSPTGTVTFKDGSTTLGTEAISGSTASFTTADLSAGDHTITAVYSGDDNNQPAASAGVDVVVAKVTPSLAVTVSDSNPLIGATVTLTASLTDAVSPTGSVTFKDGSTVLGAETLSGGSASLAVSSLSAGSHSITAAFDGDTANERATSAAITINVELPTLVLSPSGGTLSSGTVASAYTASVTASEGTAPYSFAVTAGSLPDGLTLSSAGTLSGTPTTAGASSFTITATDSNGATGSASYSLTVTSPDVAFGFSPSSGSLPGAMAGEDYSQSITASGGSGSLIYSVASGSLPPGMVLNISNGTLSGPLDDGSEGSYRFTIGVRDGNGSTGSADYSITVAPRAVTVQDQPPVSVEAGETPPDVYLNRGATGGPFISAELVSVEPSNAGTASIRSGDLADASGSTPVGWYLQFTPNPAYSGQARVGYRLFSALGSSNAGTITYRLSHDPDEVADEVNAQVEDFVRTRQSLIASSLHVPGLIERRRMDQSKEAVSTRMTPGEDGMSLGFSTSLAQINAARNDGKADPSRFNLWIDGSVSAFTDKEETDGEWGSFAMLNLGADYLVNERLLLGLSFHYDRMNDRTDADAAFKGDGWLAGPYASFEIVPNVFWDTSLLYGGSVNSIDTGLWSGDFDTRRILADTAITGQWMLSPETTLTPKLRAVYFSETVDDYTVENGSGDTVAIEGFDEEQFRLSLGAELARTFTLADGGKFTPKLGLNAGYAGLDGAGAFASATAGLSWKPDDAWTLDANLLFTIEGDGTTSVGVKARAGRTF
ncbi:MAG: Ig-like domain repeat protein [Allorhizobium sp.]